MIARRDLLRWTLGVGGLVLGCVPARRLAAPPLRLEEASLAELGDALRTRRLTARELCDAYLARIRRFNPKLRAVIEINPQAEALADESDHRRRLGTPRVLEGIPLLIKDNVETTDRMQTTAGARILEGVPVRRDAFLVHRLRAAGAIILAKANLTQWGGPGRVGWSERGGLSVNPYAADHTVLGSSAGTAAGVSAGLAAAGVGTETVGSIVGPSSLAGVVGLRPTTGCVSRAGVVPFSPLRDSPGPIARFVRDAALLLQLMTGPDPDDVATHRPELSASDCLAQLDASALRGARLGVLYETGSSSPLFAEALNALRHLGATLIEPIPLPEPPEAISAAWDEIVETEFKAALAEYLHLRRDGVVLSLEAIRDDNLRQARTRDFPAAWLGQDFIERSLRRGPIGNGSHRRARALLDRFNEQHGIERVLSDHHLAALVALGPGPAPHIDAPPPPLTRSIFHAGLAGTPALTVPAGFVDGLPVGLLFFGARGGDARVLALGYAFEQGTRHWRPPAL